jgi:hypothetical protein
MVRRVSAVRVRQRLCKSTANSGVRQVPAGHELPRFGKRGDSPWSWWCTLTGQRRRWCPARRRPQCSSCSGPGADRLGDQGLAEGAGAVAAVTDTRTRHQLMIVAGQVILGQSAPTRLRIHRPAGYGHGPLKPRRGAAPSEARRQCGREGRPAQNRGMPRSAPAMRRAQPWTCTPMLWVTMSLARVSPSMRMTRACTRSA